jgi:hypothetical protein
VFLQLLKALLLLKKVLPKMASNVTVAAAKKGVTATEDGDVSATKDG